MQKEAISRWENDHVRDIRALHLARLAEVYNQDVRVYLRLLLAAADRQ